jgi:ABC transporter transmembrane region
VSEIIQSTASCVELIIVSLYLNVELAAILLCCLPVIGTATAKVMKLVAVSTLEGQAQYAKAGAVANEVSTYVYTYALSVHRWLLYCSTVAIVHVHMLLSSYAYCKYTRSVAIAHL